MVLITLLCAFACRDDPETRCASRGANVVILAQTTVNNPALPGTIQDAAAACVAVGGEALAIKTDITVGSRASSRSRRYKTAVDPN